MFSKRFLHSFRQCAKSKGSRRAYYGNPNGQCTTSSFERLEDRRLLAAGIFFDPERGQVDIFGTGANDVAEVSREGDQIHVLVFAAREWHQEAFLHTSVRQIVFLGQSGDDQFDNRTAVPSKARGGEGNDRLLGGMSDDKLFGDAGDDVIFGRDGDDLLHGVAGRDTLAGNAGDDLLFGHSDDDQLDGDAGDDRLLGGGGNDRLHGGAGDDVADGSGADDLVRGGTGEDRIVGGWGNDVLLGEDDRDSLLGNSGRDILIGGAGHDTIDGNENEDILIGSTTEFDLNDTALGAIGNVWASQRDYADRVAELQGVRFDFPLVSQDSVHDDRLRDVITGSSGRDWFFLPGEFNSHDPSADVARFLSSLDEFTDLRRQEQVNSVVPHANNAVMRTEHFALFDLVKYSDITHTAITSGDWSNPRTWQNGQLPADGANVLIGHHVEVTVDSQIAHRFRTIRVGGGLQFATDRDTRLAVDTLVVDHGGVLRMGTEAQPIPPEVTAQLLLTDSGPIDRSWDPFELSRGAIIHGEAIVYGAEKTPFLALATPPRRGATWLELAAEPVNWRVGDKLVLAGTHRTERQDEQLEILEIEGSRLRVAPLKHNHLVPRRGLAVHLANLTRNASIISENTDDRRAHLMFMHTPHVNLHYLGVYHLGRTNKLEPVNDSVVDENLELVPGTGTNQRGRYAVHFHRSGVVDNGNPARVHGSVVVDSRGWGYVNHSSFVQFTDNVAYDVDGAAFVTEAGDEIGSFEGNFAVHSTGSGQGIDSRDEIQDFGHQGDGFWFQGGGASVVGNVAAGQSGNGFVFFTRGLMQEGLGTTVFLTENLADPSIARDQATISVGEVPLHQFRNNVAYSSATGAATRFHKLGETHAQQSVIEDLALWHNVRGLHIPYTNALVIRNVEIIGTPGNPWGRGIDRNDVTRNITYEDVVVEGFRYGIRVPQRGENILVSGRLRNTQNLLIESAVRDNRVVRILEGVQMQTVRGYGSAYNIFMQAVIEPNDESVEHLFFNDSVFWHGPDGLVQIYFAEQSADFVPFPEAGEYIPQQYVGKTNQELWDEFGKAIGGQIVPSDARQLSGVYGLATYVAS